MRPEALDQDEIHRRHTRQQLGQSWFFSHNLMQQGPATGRGDEYFVGAGEAVAIAVLARLIHIEGVMSVLDGGNRQAGSP
jgi:hypothetical protein